MPARFRTSHGSLTAAALLFFLGSGAMASQSRVEILAEEAAVTRPKKISGERPVYTEMARRARVQGVVIVESVIDEEGNVTRARVLRGLPMGLDEAALEALETWKFEPATQEGRPVPVSYTLTVNFRIEGGSRFGPVFSKLLEKNPELAEHLSASRYEEALELLDRWGRERPSDPEVSFARSHVLLEQRRLEEAFQEALTYRGPDSFEIFFRIAAFAWYRSYYDKVLSTEARAEVIDLGLQAEALARVDPKNSVDLIFLEGLLLQEKAKVTRDPSERQSLFDEAQKLLDWSLARPSPYSK
jgi:TonB family protein